MKKSILAVALSLSLTSVGAADQTDAGPSVLSNPAPVVSEASSPSDAAVVDGVPMERFVQPRRQVRSSQPSGPIARLIEIERRKNAWLVRTFFGR